MRSAWAVAISLVHAAHAQHTAAVPAICDTPEVRALEATCDMKAVIRVSANLLEGGRNDTHDVDADVAAACACVGILDRLADRFNETCPNGTMLRQADDMHECHDGHCTVQECCVDPYFTGEGCPAWQVVASDPDLCRDAGNGTLLEPCPVVDVCHEFFIDDLDNDCFRGTVEPPQFCSSVCHQFIHYCGQALPSLIDAGFMSENMTTLMRGDSPGSDICGCPSPAEAARANSPFPEGTNCTGEDGWPNLARQTVCGDCTVLVQIQQYGGMCSEYCHSLGRDCIGAWEDENDSCQIHHEGSCWTSFGETSDAICQCSPDTQHNDTLHG